MPSFRKFLTIAFALTALALGVDLACSQGFILNKSGTLNGTRTPSLVAGTLAPASQTPTMPSVSTWGPSCLDASWGTGCDVATQLCKAPTLGTPSQPCAPPKELVVTGGTGNGTSATINYTSYASYAFPTNTPIVISGATQLNWNTPGIHISAAPTYGGAGCSAGQQLVTITYAALGTAPFHAGQTIYISGLSVNALNTFPNFTFTGVATGPNGTQTVIASSTTTTTFCIPNTISGTAIVNPDGFFGYAFAPWLASASSCVGATCSVTFANPNSCASSCVSGTTQIVAGQNDDVVAAWHYGENVPFSVGTGARRVCVDAHHISPIKYVAFSEDAGPWTKVTTAIPDPWGNGQSQLSTTISVYCINTDPSVADGEHEIRAIAVATSGIVHQLSSVITAQATAGNPLLSVPAHGYQDFARIGITNSFDPNFPNYNWQYFGQFLSTAGITITSATQGATTATFNFTQPGILPPFTAGQTVLVSGLVTTGNTCNITGGTGDGAHLTLTYTGACTYPVGSTINISGTVLTNNPAICTAITCFQWNGNGAKVTASSAGSVTVPSMSTNTYVSGGSISANWNGVCLTQGGTGSGTIVCPNLANASTTRSSGGSITSMANMFSVVGGNADDPAPYDPAGIPLVGQMTPDAIPLIPTLSTSSALQNFTGCSSNPCGVVPSQDETLWLTRKDAGIDEQRTAGNAGQLNNNGSLFLYSNTNGTLKSVTAYVDTWGASSSGTSCINPPAAAGSVPASFAGTPCPTTTHARFALEPKADAAVQTLSNSGGCLVFTNANNAVAPAFYVNEPVEFGGYDANATPQLAWWGQYWIQSVVSTAVTISATPGGPCINATAANIHNVTGSAGQASLYGDLGFDNIALMCNVAAGCSNSNPQSTPGGAATSLAGLVYYARTGWLSIIPDTADGATLANTNFTFGQGGWFSGAISQGGRIRLAVDIKQSEISLSSAVAVNATPPVTTITGGSGAGTTETLTFASGNLFQAVTATGSPGQDIVVAGVTPSDMNCGTRAAPCHVLTSTATSITFTNPNLVSTLWTSGGTITPQNLILEFPAGTFAYDPTNNQCAVTGGTITAGIATVTYTGGCTYTNGQNVTVSGTTTPLGTINGDDFTNAACTGVPCNSIALKVTAGNGTIAAGGFLSNMNGTCANITTNNPINTGAALACKAGYIQNAAFKLPGTNPTAWPWHYFGSGNTAGTVPSQTSNCLPVPEGQSGQASKVTYVDHIDPSTAGGKNDILYLEAPGNSLFPSDQVNAYNNCGTGPFFFSNSSVLFEGASNGFGTDIWEDSQSVLGPSWYGDFGGGKGQLNTISPGGYYITNVVKNNAQAAFDEASYAWGSRSFYNEGLCGNNAYILISVQCFAVGSTVIPTSLGGASNAPNNTGWRPITGSFTGPAGTGTSLTQIDNTTKSISVATGDLPNWLMPGLFAYMICNFTPGPVQTSSAALVNGGNLVIAAYNNNTSPATLDFTTTGGISPTCPLTSSPYVWFYDARHIDLFTYLYNQDVPPSLNSGVSAGNLNYARWMHWNDFIFDNTWGNLGGTVQGIGIQGANFWNYVFANGAVTINQGGAPGNGSFKAVGLTAQGGYINNLIMNSQIYGTVFQIESVTDAAVPIVDEFHINNDGFGQPGFPTITDLDTQHTGFWTSSMNALWPSTGSTSVGGAVENMAIFPTPAWGTNPATTKPNTVGQPGVNNFLACPWYCPNVGDSGLGSM